MKKITRATIKSWIKRNFDNLYVKKCSRFDGMTDGIETIKNAGFEVIERTSEHLERTFGIKGVWFVGDGRDWWTEYNDEEFTGWDIHNCCGSFVLAIRKEN
jgi:hypothetical protein